MTTPEQIAATQRTGLSDAQLCVLDVLLTNEGTERGRAVAVVAALREAGMLTDAEAKPIRFYTRTIADLMRERDSLAAQLEAARQAAAEVQRHWQYGHQTYLGSGVAALIRTLAAPVEPQPEPEPIEDAGSGGVR